MPGVLNSNCADLNDTVKMDFNTFLDNMNFGNEELSQLTFEELGLPVDESLMTFSSIYDLSSPIKMCKPTVLMGKQDPILSSCNAIPTPDRNREMTTEEKTQHFGAWGHRSIDTIKDEFPDVYDILDCSYEFANGTEETDSDFSQPTSPVVKIEQGCESDVDIETVSDVSFTGGLCDQIESQPNSPNSSSSRCSSGSSSPTSFCKNGVSSNFSLAENLIRFDKYSKTKKPKKEKRKNKSAPYQAPTQPTFPSYPVYPFGTVHTSSANGVNFHDYAMSPLVEESVETAQPTVPVKKNCKRSSKNSNSSSASSTSSSSSGSDPEKDKQDHHNQLERARRQKLADLFEDLRLIVPSQSTGKAPKVQILKQAKILIKHLESKEKFQEDQIVNLNLERARLEQKLLCMRSLRS